MQAKRPASTFLFVAAAAALAAGAALHAQAPLDSDQDGLPDALEQQLLEQFAPHFLLADNDCAIRPALFAPGVQTPTAQSNNGTIYGQVFPAAASPGAVEIHYYHLWEKDCGPHGHHLDTEHVAVLVRAAPTPAGPTWKAAYWYAAAHENTVCELSQITRASTVQAEDHGATVSISPGKHASYLAAALCGGGCGADRCEHMVPLHIAAIINLGEPGRPMNGSVFIASSAWPLTTKMSTTNFPAQALARVDALPPTDIAWFIPGHHPAQGVIASGTHTGAALAGSERNTATALSLAGGDTAGALSTAGSSTGHALSATDTSTGNALGITYRHTEHALGSTARHVGRALHLTPGTTPAQPH